MRAGGRLCEFAGAAFAFELSCVAQAAEERRVAINGSERLAANVAGGERQESAGKYLAGMRDEDEAFTVIQASRRTANGIGHFLRSRACE